MTAKRSPLPIETRVFVRDRESGVWTCTDDAGLVLGTAPTIRELLVMVDAERDAARAGEA